MFDAGRLSLVEPPMRELLLALSHDILVLSLLVRVAREAIGGGGEISPEHLSSTLEGKSVERSPHADR